MGTLVYTLIIVARRSTRKNTLVCGRVIVFKAATKHVARVAVIRTKAIKAERTGDVRNLIGIRGTLAHALVLIDYLGTLIYAFFGARIKVFPVTFG